MFSAACTGCYGNPKLEDIDLDPAMNEDYAAWHSANNPAYVDGTLAIRFADLPRAGSAPVAPADGQAVAWPSTYWPAYEDSINSRSASPNELSPAAKFDAAFGLNGALTRAVSEKLGVRSQSNRPTCFVAQECGGGFACVRDELNPNAPGRCIPTSLNLHAAVNATRVLFPELTQTVTYNGVVFQPRDLHAMISALSVYNPINLHFSERCDEENAGNGLTDGDYGRPAGGNGECRDMNPATYHVLLTNYLGIMKRSFVEDRTYDDEVWNQPLRSYVVKVVEPMTREEVLTLVPGARLHPSAKNFRRLTTEVTGDVRVDTYHYILETDDHDNVLGGEWTGSSADRHPDFIWNPGGMSGSDAGLGGLKIKQLKPLVDVALASPRVETRVLADGETAYGGSSRYFNVGVPEGQELTLTLEASGADLLIRRGAAPTIYTNDGSAEGDAPTKTLTIPASSSAVTYGVRVMPHGEEDVRFKLTATLTR